MLKKCIAILNNFILWTKQWHVLHCIFIINTIAFFICMLTCIPMTYDALIEGLYLLYFLYPLAVFIAVPLAIIIIVIKFITKQPVTVESSILLKGPIYNIIYMLNIMYIFFVILANFSLFLMDWEFLDEVDNPMAIGAMVSFTMVALIAIAIEFVIYTAMSYIFIKIQNHQSIEKKNLPFR